MTPHSSLSGREELARIFQPAFGRDRDGAVKAKDLAAALVRQYHAMQTRPTVRDVQAFFALTVDELVPWQPSTEMWMELGRLAVRIGRGEVDL